MALTLKQIEGAPANYPVLPVTTTLDKSVLWARIEPYIAYRWGQRSVFWVVEGPGEWIPPLTPATISAIEYWSSADAWVDATDMVTQSPLGYYLPATGPYRFTGTAGEDGVTVPAIVVQAFQRLADYMSAKADRHPGSSSESLSVGESIRNEFRRDPAWAAKALQNSGAADLLRAYRRAM